MDKMGARDGGLVARLCVKSRTTPCFALGSVEEGTGGQAGGQVVGRFVVAVGSGSGRNAVIKVWRAEPRREICQSNWTERLETCCMIHPTDA